MEAPTRRELAAYAALYGLVSQADPDAERKKVAELVELFEQIREIDQLHKRRQNPRSRFYRKPSPNEDPNGAIRYFCDIRGASYGSLRGLRVGVKDSITVAGVPMEESRDQASEIFPTYDALVVERLLDAGAVVVAKTAMGLRTRNPVDARFSSGGSSSGSAAAVASGLTDAALGAEQGGSIRVPAAWCGIVGLKATYGLIPTHGLTGWGQALDHIGPMTRRVETNAAMLNVLAHGTPPSLVSTHGGLAAVDYTSTLDKGIAGLRIGVITESVDPKWCAKATLDALQKAEEAFAGMGALVTHVSIPMWQYSFTLWQAAVTLGVATIGEYSHPALPDATNAMLLAAEHLRRKNRSESYCSHLRNLRAELDRQVDELFAEVDLLISPTWPTGAERFADESEEFDSEDQSWKMNWTCLFNLTGHPALSIPSFAGDENMPTGLQIVGRKFDEATIYLASFAFEKILLGGDA